jgi:tetratricopeptide (TPR) repeat protein
MFKKAIEVDRGYWGVYRFYGNFLYDHERYQEAIEQYSLVVQFTPDSGIGFDNLANAYWATGDFEKAEQAFRRSLEIRPSRWAYSNLGSMQYYLGNFAAAVENQLRAIELAPENQEAWGRLAEAYRFIPGNEAAAQSAYATAIELVRKELLINPDNWINVALLGQYYAHTGRRDEAYAQMRKVLELAPMAPTAYYFDALVKWRYGETDDVYRDLERALELGMSPVFIRTDPDFASLRGKERFERLLERHKKA